MRICKDGGVKMKQKSNELTRSSEVQGSGKMYATVSLIALSLALVIALSLFARETIISLKSYNPMQGISGSPWVGFQNFQKLFASSAFVRVIKNTLLFNLLFSTMLFAVAGIVGYIVITLPRRGREILAVFFALIVFLPTEVYASWLIHLFGSRLFIDAQAMRFLFPFLTTIKYLGIPIMVMYIHNEIYVKIDPLIPVKVAGLFSLSSLAFITNGFFSMTNSLYNPLTYETMDMADTYTFRSGLMQMEVGINTAVGVIKTGITILSVAILFIPILFLIRSIFQGERKETVDSKVGGRLISAIISLAIFAAIYFLPYIAKGRSFTVGQLSVPSNLGYPIGTYLFLSAISAMLATIIAAILSGAFKSANRTLRLASGVLLTLITILTIRPVNISNYLLMRELGVVNTGFAIILATAFSAAAVWAMASMACSDHKVKSESILFSIIGLFLIQTAVIYGNVIPQLIYLMNTQIAPLLIFRQLHTGMQAIGDAGDRASSYGVIGLYGFIIALPSLLLFLLANIVLPRNKLLAIISAGTKS